MDYLKEGNANITFPNEEADFIKLILMQLAKEEGLSHKLWQDKEGIFTLDEIHQFIQDDIDYLEKSGYDETTIKGVVLEMDMLFQLSARVKLEECHRILDCYALNIQPYLYTYQLNFLENLRHNLMCEMARAFVNAAIYCGDLGELIKDAMELSEVENVSDLYGEEDDLIKDEYVQRDKSVISFLNSNPAFKAYVEKRAGATINEIWRINDGEH